MSNLLKKLQDQVDKKNKEKSKAEDKQGAAEQELSPVRKELGELFDNLVGQIRAIDTPVSLGFAGKSFYYSVRDKFTRASAGNRKDFPPYSLPFKFSTASVRQSHTHMFIVSSEGISLGRVNDRIIDCSLDTEFSTDPERGEKYLDSYTEIGRYKTPQEAIEGLENFIEHTL